MTTTPKPNPLIDGFETKAAAAEYGQWFKTKVEESLQSPLISHEEALAHFAAKRAERMEK